MNHPMSKMLSVYLAGPMTNCSERQKTVWRKRMKAALKNDFKCLDPTDPKAQKGALAVTADIEQADVVIANMWRESIGTTLGIVQAKRMGIPVILIDQHCLDSPILKSVVGDFIVHSEEAAINKLRHEIAPTLTTQLSVVKRNGKTVPFDIKKLQKSLKAACLGAGVDDPIFHILLSRRVQRAILTGSDGSPIQTTTIRERVLQELRNIAQDLLGDGDAKQVEHANSLLFEWEYKEESKEELRSEQQKENEYLVEVEELSGRNSELELEVENLRARLAVQPSPAKPDAAQELERPTEALTDVIRARLGKKKALCIGRIGKTTFASAFERRGVQYESFLELFEEKALEGKQSNLNHDLKNHVKAYPYVLYACDGLRHLSDSLRGVPNLVVGAGPNDAVRKFLVRMAPAEQKR